MADENVVELVLDQPRDRISGAVNEAERPLERDVNSQLLTKPAAGLCFDKLVATRVAAARVRPQPAKVILGVGPALQKHLPPAVKDEYGKRPVQAAAVLGCGELGAGADGVVVLVDETEIVGIDDLSPLLLPLLVGGVVGLSFLLLLMVFRSVAVAVKAAVLNLLSLGAAYGIVALVLQGGGALGSYQAGVVERLAESGIEVDWVAGISIGAINAAIFAGNPPERRVERLRTFWESAAAGLPWFPILPDDQIREWVHEWSASVVLATGVPGFFRPRFTPPQFATPGSAAALSYYDTTPLRETLDALRAQAQSGERSGTIRADEIKDTQLRGRDFLGLLQGMPGVVDTNVRNAPGWNAFLGTQINGLSDQLMGMSYDGVSSKDTGFGAAVGPLVMLGGVLLEGSTVRSTRLDAKPPRLSLTSTDRSDPAMVACHDDEWGVPEFDDRALFEKLVLDGFQAGLSWITILRKRDNFRRAFDGFVPEKIARYTPKKVERLMPDAGIVRNRQKVDAKITGQNGASANQRPALEAPCGKARKAKAA